MNGYDYRTVQDWLNVLVETGIEFEAVMAWRDALAALPPESPVDFLGTPWTQGIILADPQLRKWFGCVGALTMYSVWSMSGLELPGVDLSGADLEGVELSGADLYGANLRSAKLSAASFCFAYMEGADLTDADARRADFYGAALSHAKLGGLRGLGADFEGANVAGVVTSRHTEVDFEHANLG